MSATKLFIVKQSTPVRRLEIEIRRPIFPRPRINSLFFSARWNACGGGSY
jgi:hypothetical protein